METKNAEKLSRMVCKSSSRSIRSYPVPRAEAAKSMKGMGAREGFGHFFFYIIGRGLPVAWTGPDT